MTVEQIYTGCLAEAAYYIESNGEAAIIDPLREATPYIDRAKRDGAVIKYIFETHFHADFVSGHVELAKRSGGEIIYGPNAHTQFEAYNATDGETFTVGELLIKAIHTPGHTSESTTYLLYDNTGKPYCIFTGDTLFIGDVGRPDLAQKGGATMEEMAATLYDSIHEKIWPLPDHILVYPAHGAGSACGKNMSKETFDTLGHQKQVNYALRAPSKEQFILEVTEGILPPPQYFAKNAALNKNGISPLEQVFKKGMHALTVNDFESIANSSGALLLDIRGPQDFAAGFIPNSINIGLNGQFAPWVGSLIIDMHQPILLISDPENIEEAITRLSRVGYDNTIGYLDGGFASWVKAGNPTDSVLSITAEAFKNRVDTHQLRTLDVRKPGEFAIAHLDFSKSRPLDYINEWCSELNPSDTYYIHCAGGYRSMIAASILKSRGIAQVIDIAGGYGALASHF